MELTLEEMREDVDCDYINKTVFDKFHDEFLGNI